MASLTPTPKFQFINAAGEPLFLGRLYSYAAGTDTLLDTYTDSTGNTANTNPIILDEYGSANIWLGAASYKLVLKDSSDSTIWTVNNVGGTATQADIAAIYAAFAASGGSALIGFIQAGSNAIARTAQAKMRERVSFDDFETPQQAVDSGASLVYIGPSTYTLAAPLVVPPGVSLIGQGDASIIDGSSLANGTRAVNTTGSVASSTTLTGDVARFATVLPLTSVSGVSAGTLLLVRSTLNNSWSGFRTYRKQGFYQVLSVSGLNVTLTEELSTSFQSASTVVDVIAPTTQVFRDFRVIGKSGGDSYALTIDYGLDCLVENVRVSGADAVGFGNGNSRGTTFRSCRSFINASAVDTQYAFAVSSSDYTLIDDCDAYGTRHAVAIVGDQARKNKITNSRLSGSLRGADIHGNGDDTTYEGCFIQNGITFSGRDSHYINCQVEAPSNGIVQLATEIMGGTHEIVGGSYTYNGNSITTGWSPFDLGRGSTAINTDTEENMTFRYLNASMSLPNLAGNFIRIQNTSAFKANFDVRGLTIDMPSIAGIVRYEGAPSGADADFAIVDDVEVNASGVVQIFKQGSAASGYATTKMRMQRCGQIVTGAATVAGTSVPLVYTHRYEYPKAPMTLYSYVGPRNPSGSGGNETYTSLTTVTILASTVTVTTTDGSAFGADFTVQANITTGIEEL